MNILMYNKERLKYYFVMLGFEKTFIEHLLCAKTMLNTIIYIII